MFVNSFAQRALMKLASQAANFHRDYSTGSKLRRLAMGDLEATARQKEELFQRGVVLFWDAFVERYPQMVETVQPIVVSVVETGEEPSIHFGGATFTQIGRAIELRKQHPHQPLLNQIVHAGDPIPDVKFLRFDQPHPFRDLYFRFSEPAETVLRQFNTPSKPRSHRRQTMKRGVVKTSKTPPTTTHIFALPPNHSSLTIT